ncbi:MAG: hypothetical protein P9L99_21445 [Candidatus Lernaella stagnicola]|nr:hypothetical protein [Candidatus Lernaella stagnicola]
MSESKNLVGRLVDASEEKLQDIADELLSNPRFAEALGRAIRRADETKGAVDRNLRLVLNMVNVPTKADYDDLVRKVVKLGDTISKMETRLDAMASRLEKLADRWEEANGR